MTTTEYIVEREFELPGEQAKPADDTTFGDDTRAALGQVGTALDVPESLTAMAEASADPVAEALGEQAVRATRTKPNVPLTDEECELVEQHMPLAEHIAKQFVSKGESLEDLTQVAYIALMGAVQRFEPARGNLFSSYAIPTIAGALKRYFRDHGWDLRVPRRLQEAHLHLNTTIAELRQQLGRDATMLELAEASGYDEATVRMALEAGQAYRASSLDAPLSFGEPNGSTISSNIMDPIDSIEDFEDRLALVTAIKKLDRRTQWIIKLRLQGMTQDQIAEETGISQMHVSRILSWANEDLREIIQQPDAEPRGSSRRKMKARASKPAA